MGDVTDDVFEASGLACTVRQDFEGCWQGMVCVDQTHALFGKHRGTPIRVPAQLDGHTPDPGKVCMADVKGRTPGPLVAGAVTPLSIAVEADGGGIWSVGRLRTDAPDLWTFSLRLRPGASEADAREATERLAAQIAMLSDVHLAHA